MAEAAINLTAGQKADRKLDMIFVDAPDIIGLKQNPTKRASL